MSSKTINVLGWILTGLITFVFLATAVLKLSGNQAAQGQATALGLDLATFQLLGVIEILSVILFVIPRTGVVGTFLLIAYMGGAIAGALGHHQPITVVVILQILIWITAVLRFPELRQRLFSGSPTTKSMN